MCLLLDIYSGFFFLLIQILFRWMYLADSSEVPKILRIGMDGSKQQVLVRTGISAPRAITIGIYMLIHYCSIPLC